MNGANIIGNRFFINTDGDIDDEVSGWWAYKKNNCESLEGKDNFKEGPWKEDEVFPHINLLNVWKDEKMN